MKVKIDADEWYPMYSIVPNYGKEVDVSPDFVETYNNVMKDLNIIQDILRDLYEN